MMEVEYNLKESYVSMMEQNSGFASSSISQGYINTSGIAQYIIQDSGVVCSLTNSPSSLPINAKIGDFGSAGDYMCSDGSEISNTWILKANSGIAQYEGVQRYTLDGVIQNTVTFALDLDTNSNPTKIEMIIYYPEYDTKLTLVGEPN